MLYTGKCGGKGLLRQAELDWAKTCFRGMFLGWALYLHASLYLFYFNYTI